VTESNDDEMETDDSVEFDVPVPTVAEMVQALEVLRRGVQAKWTNFDAFHAFEGQRYDQINDNRKKQKIAL